MIQAAQYIEMLLYHAHYNIEFYNIIFNSACPVRCLDRYTTNQTFGIGIKKKTSHKGCIYLFKNLVKEQLY